MSSRDAEETLIANKPHIMFVSYPLQGHMNPLIQFSKRLVSRGIKVTIVTTTAIEASSLAKTSSINMEHISIDTPPSDSDTPDIINEFLVLFRIAMTRSLPEVIEKQKAKGCPVKILVYDALMPWAVGISQKLGVQGVAFCTHSSAVFAIYCNVYSKTLDIDSLGEFERVELPALPLLGIRELPSLVYDVGTYQGLSRLVVSQFLEIGKAECVLFNTFDKLELEPNDPSIDESLALLKVGVTRGLPEVTEKYKTTECPVKVLVYDPLMPWALDISQKLGIPGVAFCTHSSAVFAIYYNVYLRTLDINSVGELSSVKLPSLPVLGIKDLPSLVYDPGA